MAERLVKMGKDGRGRKSDVGAGEQEEQEGGSWRQCVQGTKRPPGGTKIIIQQSPLVAALELALACSIAVL